MNNKKRSELEIIDDNPWGNPQDEWLEFQQVEKEYEVIEGNRELPASQPTNDETIFPFWIMALKDILRST